MQSPQTIIFILLIFTYWCSKGHGDNIEMRREIRQERAFNPSHSTGQLHRIPSSSTLRSSDASQQAAAFESGILCQHQNLTINKTDNDHKISSRDI